MYAGMIRKRIGALKHPLALLRALVHRVRRLGIRPPDRTMPIPFDGQVILGNPSIGGILEGIYLRGYHEFAATACMKQRVKRGMTVIDVGADKGYNTLLAARRVGASGKVHAFEPLERAREQLIRNLAANGYSNVVIHDVALFDEDKHLAMSGSRLAGGDATSVDRVHCVPFDSLPAAVATARIGFVKIDVEGAEFNVLKGMRRMLARDRPEILVEVHPPQLRTFGYSVAALVSFLESLGYEPRPLMITRGLFRAIVAGELDFKCRLDCRATRAVREAHRPSDFQVCP
jgi:FkbM family methyltransferase